MALTRRQIACFERNTQFLDEVAAALLPIAAALTKEALVTENTTDVTEIALKVAAIKRRIADQIFKEQGINVQGDNVLPSALPANATSGSQAMKYLVQQMLLSPLWDMTPDEWAADELAARAMITTTMQTMLTALTAVPVPE